MRRMKVGTLGIGAAGLSLVAVAFAFHLELSARSRAYSELRGLRAETTTDLDQHRISASRAAALDGRLGQARKQIEENDVLGAQKLLDRVKADLRDGTRSA